MARVGWGEANAAGAEQEATMCSRSWTVVLWCSIEHVMAWSSKAHTLA